MIILENITKDTVIARCDDMEDVVIEAGESAEFTQEQTDYLQEHYKGVYKIVGEEGEGPKEKVETISEDVAKEVEEETKKEEKSNKKDEPIEPPKTAKQEKKESKVKKVIKKITKKKK